MNKNGQFIAALLEASPKTYAAGAALALMERDEDTSSAIDAMGFDELVAVVQERVLHLAQALACGRVEVFMCDLDWTLALECGPGISKELLREVLVELRASFAGGLPDMARQLVDEYLERGVRFLDGEGIELIPEPDVDPELDALRQRFQAALLAGDKHRASDVVLGALQHGVSIDQLQSAVLGRAQVEIGQLWQQGHVTVAQEHFGSRVVENLVARLRSEFDTPSPDKGKVLLASVAGNDHDIGLRMLADQLENEGWQPIFLGANFPDDNLREALDDYQPDFVALSVALLSNLQSAARTIRTLKASHPQLPVLVGGAALRRIEGLWRDLGADGFARSAADAIAWATTQRTA